MAYASWSVVFGEQPSAAKWNILGTNDAAFNAGTGIANLEIGSGHTSLKNDYKFSVCVSSGPTLTSGSAIPFDTKNFDTGTNVDVATNKGRFTAPVAGFYFFKAAVSCTTASSSTSGFLSLFKNAAEVSRGPKSNFTGFTDPGFIISDVLQLAANDFVTAVLTSGASMAIAASAVQNIFSGFLVSQT